MSADDTFERQCDEWTEVCGDWLRLVFAPLSNHARQLAQGDRGVLEVNIDVFDMERMLAAKHLHEWLDPVWISAYDFIEMANEAAGIGAETAQRWADSLSLMDPTRDVALFLHSTANPQGQWCSRFLVVHNAQAPVH